jgi:hypothetical protein
MDIIPSDLYSNIFCFLSPNDQLILRRVSKIFEKNVKSKILIICKLNRNLEKIYLTETKLVTDLTLIENPIFYFYIFKKIPTVHTLFRQTNIVYDTCIVENCRNQKIGYIYYSKRKSPYHQQYNWNFYSKRRIPYCLTCFNTHLQ